MADVRANMAAVKCRLFEKAHPVSSHLLNNMLINLVAVDEALTFDLLWVIES